MDNKFSEFIDAEDYTAKEKTTFEDLVMMHMRKISEISSNDFSEGYWNKKVTQSGVSEIYHPDTRKAYINAVNFLHDILLPKFDKEMNDFLENQEKEIEELNSKELEDSPYWNEAVNVKRKTFQQIQLLLNRIRFFDTMAAGE